MKIENNKECFVMLWRKLERTRRLLGGQYRRFSVRNVIRSWWSEIPPVPQSDGMEYDTMSRDDFTWEVCFLSDLQGNDELPVPQLYPRVHREFLRALVAVTLGIGVRRVDLKALDSAYSEVFPSSTPLNINKKKRTTEPE